MHARPTTVLFRCLPAPARRPQIHGVWFYDTADLEALGKILKKIVDQLPKPDGGTSGHDEAPPPYPSAAAAAAPPQAPMAAPSAPVPIPAASSAVAEATGGGGDDAFWDRSVHVTEDTITGQRLVPNESLVLQDTASSQQVGVTEGFGGGRPALQGDAGLAWA